MERLLFAVVVDSVRARHDAFIAGLRRGFGAYDASLLVVVSHPAHPRRGNMLRNLASSGRLAGAVLTAMPDRSDGSNRSVHLVKDLSSVPLLTFDFCVPGVAHLERPRAAALAAGLSHLGALGRTRPVVLSDFAVPRSMLQTAVPTQVAVPPVLRAASPRDVGSAVSPLLVTRSDGNALADGLPFDGLMATDDDLALAALEVLRDHGVRVPDDVAVVGSGMTAIAATHDPTLTSIEESLNLLGEDAAESLLHQVHASSPHRAAVPLISRRHSGGVRVVAGATSSGRAQSTPPGQMTTIEQRPASPLPTPSDGNEDILDALSQTRSRYFSGVVSGDLGSAEERDLLGDVTSLVARCPEPIWWAAVMEALHRDVAINRSGDLGRDVRADLIAARIELVVERTLSRERLERDRGELETARQLLDLAQVLSDCCESAVLVDALTEYLPRIGVKSCFLALTSPSAEGLPLAELIFNHVRGRTDDVGLADAPYPATSLVPAHLECELHRGAWVLQPLFSNDSWFGYLLTDQADAVRNVSEALRQSVSRALADHERARQLARRAQEHEVMLESRTVELRYEAATRRSAQEALSAVNIQLREAMLVDGLTELQNRASLDLQGPVMWDRHVKEGTPLSVLMVDVDHFKAYNDRYGHVAGDECLRRIAGCLGDVARRSDDFVARYGGEEFVVLMTETPADGAATVARQLLGEVRAASLPGVDTVDAKSGARVDGVVSVSIGSATSSPQAPRASLQDLLMAADTALYRAKKAGRDRFVALEEDPAQLAGSGPQVPA